MLIKATIEEHLTKEVNIYVPDDVKDPMDYASQIVRDKYFNEDIVLTSDDHNGVTLIQLEDEEGRSTEWCDL